MLTVSRAVDNQAISSDEERSSRNRIEMCHYQSPRSVKKQTPIKHGRELIDNGLTRSGRVVDNQAISSDEERSSRNRIEMCHYQSPRSVKNQTPIKHGRELIDNGLTKSDNKKRKTFEGDTTTLGRGRELIDNDLARSDNKKQKTYEDVTTALGFLIDLGLVFTGLDPCYFASLNEKVTSKMCKSVVSLLLCDGPINVLACSGIAIDSKTPTTTRLLTSERLGITFLARRNAGHDVSIRVRDASNNVALGWLEQHFVDPGFTLVNVKQPLDVCTIHLNDEVDALPGSNLLGIELTDSVGPIFKRGTLQSSASESEDGIELLASTCDISKAGDGGPLFDDNGNFVGMNLFMDTKRGAFMQRNIIIEKLEKFEKKIEKKIEFLVSKSRCNIQLRECRKFQRSIMSRTKDFALTNWDLFAEDLDSLGYPKPPTTTVGRSLVLVNNFEDIFGDPYDSSKGVWSILKETISKDLSQTVVSLASYHGDTRYFACSGIIIEWNGSAAVLTSASLVRDPRDEFMIWDGLKIVVLLPDKQQTDGTSQRCQAEGTLQHCHLHYNIAIVSFNSDRAFSTMSISDRSSNVCGKAIAVGRCFQSGMLMATKGLQNPGHCHSMLDCDALCYSSCEITKAGIGGPLIDLKGRFMGMNFYDEYEGTPFVPQLCVLKVLEHFQKKRFIAETDADGYKNRWPVPMPYWCHQDPQKEKQERKKRVSLLFRKESRAPL